MKRQMAKQVGFLVLAAAAGFVGSVLADGLSSEGIAMGRGGHTAREERPVAEQIAAPARRVSFEDEAPISVARAFQDQFRRVSADTLPVVVEINVVNRVTREPQPNPFEFFFGRPGPGNGQPREFEQRGMGSGVIVARDGATVYVLTNEHVAGGAEEIEVVLNDGRSFEASIVGEDDLIDVALLSFETSEEIPIAVLGNSDALQAGDWVFAVGNPLGFQSTITAGIVSATSRAAGTRSGMSGITDYIQTDAAINRGNSGGALVNLDGEVVGINTWIASNSGGSIGLGFAIPINNVRRAITDIIETGEVAYSWLGVQLAAHPDGDSGAFVAGVYSESPAERAGIRPGDTITAVNEYEISDSASLVRRVAALRPGEPSQFEIIRNGRPVSLSIETARRNQELVSGSTVWPGITVTPLSDEVRERLEIAGRFDGVVVGSVSAESPLRESGIRAGDLITAINGESIASVPEFYERIGEIEGEELQFRIVRNGQQLIVGMVRAAAR